MLDNRVLIDDLTEENLVVVKGDAKAILDEEVGKDYYAWLGEDRSRDFDVALEERIKRPIENSMLIVLNPDETVKFDDRKLRYDSHLKSDGRNIVRLGPTHFQEFLNVDNRAIQDDEFFGATMRRGISDFGDPGVYHSCVIAVDAIPISTERYVMMFKRSDDAKVCPGMWHIIGGMHTTDYSFFGDRNPSRTLKSQLRESLERELKQEADNEGARLEMVGLVDNFPGSVNFSYLAYVGVGYKEFLDARMGAEDRGDHSDAHVLKSKDKVYEFMKKENLVNAGYGDMLLYLKHG